VPLATLLAAALALLTAPPWFDPYWASWSVRKADHQLVINTAAPWVGANRDDVVRVACLPLRRATGHFAHGFREFRCRFEVDRVGWPPEKPQPAGWRCSAHLLPTNRYAFVLRDVACRPAPALTTSRRRARHVRARHAPTPSTRWASRKARAVARATRARPRSGAKRTARAAAGGERRL